MTSVLDGYNDWPNLMYVKGFALSPDFSVNDHFTPHPEPAQMAQPDTDDDGIADIADNCRDDPNAGQEDSDGDQVGNICDNCPSAWNPDQADTDGDTWGDPCDPVGGIAELPDVGGSSGPPYAAIAGGLAAAVVAIAAGGWYARRRWLG